MMRLNTDADMMDVPPEAIAEQAPAAVAAAPDAQACFISCTGIRPTGLIAPLEAEFGLPVTPATRPWRGTCFGVAASPMTCPTMGA